ncbi:MAG: hypothetical protein U0931_04175 [Vulcanimicrobiota bacterium]
MRRRAWTLPEALLALSLFSLVGLVVLGALRGAMRLSAVQSRRATMQAQLLTSATRLEQDLQRATSQDIVYAVVSQVGVLAIHCRKAGPAGLTPEWEPAYRCYLWDQKSGRLWRKSCPPSPPGLTAPRTDRAQTPSSSELASLAADLSQANLLADGVSDFQLTFLPGPLAQIRLELKRDNPGGKGQDRQSVLKQLGLRNRL